MVIEASEWPRDPKGFVFLARAVERLGKAIFGNHWDGTEQSAKLLLPLPAFGSHAPSREDRVTAHEAEF